MIEVIATLRDYDPTSGTASVEIFGAGTIETWVDNITVSPTLEKAHLVYGNQVVLTMPDPSRICEATVTAIYLNSQPVVQQGTSATTTNTETGFATIVLDANGHGSVSVTFPSAFTAAPTVRALAHMLDPVTISNVTTTGCTLAYNGSHGYPNGYIHTAWTATGT